MSTVLTDSDPEPAGTSGADNLSQEKLQLLLAAIGSRPAEDTTETEAAEYNWNQPHYFSSVQLKRLDDFTKTVASAMARKFSTLCHNDFDVTITSVTQHFADKIHDEIFGGEQNDYSLAFSKNEKHMCGFISIPPPTAVTWVTQMLGDTQSEGDSDKDLSQLEESLLFDAVSAIIEALADAHNSCIFRPAKNFVRRILPVKLRGTEELCKISFNVKQPESDDTPANILILCKDLQPVVGETEQAACEFSAEDISKAALEHLQNVTVSVTAQLAATALTLKELMSLLPSDILLLDKKVDEPIELIVEGRAVYRGRPAKSAGKRAVVITNTIL
jgi:flagellar motor switch protein FliM